MTLLSWILSEFSLGVCRQMSVHYSQLSESEFKGFHLHRAILDENGLDVNARGRGELTALHIAM